MQGCYLIVNVYSSTEALSDKSAEWARWSRQSSHFSLSFCISAAKDSHSGIPCCVIIRHVEQVLTIKTSINRAVPQSRVRPIWSNDHTETDMPMPTDMHCLSLIIPIPIPIWLLGLITNCYRYRLIKPIEIPIPDIGIGMISSYRYWYQNIG